MKEPADIFTLPKRNAKLKLEEIEGYGETSVRNLFAAIEGRRRISLERFIFALGMRHVGETTALALARGYGSWQAFHDACLKVAKGDEEAIAEMDALDQIGDTVIASIKAYFGESHNRGIVERLTRRGRRILDAEKPKSNSAVAGKTVVFTGSLEKMTRDEAKADGRAARRQGVGLGVEEDRLCGRRPRRRLEADGGQEARRRGVDRGRVAEADRGVRRTTLRHRRA